MRKMFSTVFMILFVMALTFSTVAGQDYKEAIKSLDQLNSVIEVIKQQLEAQGKAPKLLASTDGDDMADESSMLYSLVDNLEVVSNELQVALGDAQRVANAQPKNPVGVSHGKIKFTGFLHQQYYRQGGDDEQSTFVSKRARLGAKGKLNEYAQYKFLGEFASSPKLLDAMINLSPNKNWSLQFGQYKPPYGTEFLTSATKLPFINTHKAKSLGTDRDVGTSVTYKNKINSDFQMKLTVGVFNGAKYNTTDVNNEKNYVGRAEIKLAKTFTLAPNFIIGKSNDTGLAIVDISTYGGSANWTWKNEQVQGEYNYSKVGETEKAGWYAWAAHSFHTNAKFLPVLQALVRYEQYDVDLNVEDNKVNRLTLGTNLFIDDKYTKVQLNYQINGNETGSATDNEFLVNFQVAF